MLLFTNSKISEAQHTYVLFAALIKAEHGAQADDDGNFNITAFLNSVKYESIATIVRQWDKSTPTNLKRSTLISNTISGNYIRPGHHGRYHRQRDVQLKHCLSSEQLHFCKLFSRCLVSKTFGHRDSDQNPDATIKNHLRSNDQPLATDQENNGSGSNIAQHSHQNKNQHQPASSVVSNYSNVLKFGSACVTDGSNTAPLPLVPTPAFETSRSEPLVDGGAPYSAWGPAKLSLLKS